MSTDIVSYTGSNADEILATATKWRCVRFRVSGATYAEMVRNADQAMRQLAAGGEYRCALDVHGIVTGEFS